MKDYRLFRMFFIGPLFAALGCGWNFDLPSYTVSKGKGPANTPLLDGKTTDATVLNPTKGLYESIEDLFNAVRENDKRLNSNLVEYINNELKEGVPQDVQSFAHAESNIKANATSESCINIFLGAIERGVNKYVRAIQEELQEKEQTGNHQKCTIQEQGRGTEVQTPFSKRRKTSIQMVEEATKIKEGFAKELKKKCNNPQR